MWYRFTRNRTLYLLPGRKYLSTRFQETKTAKSEAILQNIETELKYDKKKDKSVYRTDTKNEEDTKYKEVPKCGLDDCLSFGDISVPSDYEGDKDGLYYRANKMIQTTENISWIPVKIEVHMAVMCIKKIKKSCVDGTRGSL